MATFYLLNTTYVGTTKYFPGESIDDAIDPKAAIEAAGGVCWPSADTTVAAAATLCASLRLNKGANEERCMAIMMAASASSSRFAKPAGTALTNTASQTIQVTEGQWRKLATLGQNGTLTLGTTGAIAGDRIEITRNSTDAFTYAVVNGGAGAGTLVTFPVSKAGSAVFQFDGTNWAVRSYGYPT